MWHSAEHDLTGLGIKEFAEWLLVIDILVVYLHHIMLNIHQRRLKVPNDMDLFFWWEMMAQHAQYVAQKTSS